VPLTEPVAPDLTVVLTLMPSPPGKPVSSWPGTVWPLRISACIALSCGAGGARVKRVVPVGACALSTRPRVFVTAHGHLERRAGHPVLYSGIKTP
jgi:hypothetical protein